MSYNSILMATILGVYKQNEEYTNCTLLLTLTQTTTFLY